MTIFLGADHGGYTLKERIRQYLTDQGYSVVDLGANQLDPDDDYPDFAFKVAHQVAQLNEAGQDQARGILACRSGGGMVMTANKVPGAYAVAAHTVKGAKHARTNDGANIISLAGDWLDPELLPEILDAFLQTEFDPSSRHGRRLDKIKQYEQQLVESGATNT